MSISFSKQAEKDSLLDLLFVCLALTVVLFVLVPPEVSISSALRTTSGAQESTDPDFLVTAKVSFAADQQYWDANCGHGWSSDARCDSIVARSQSCAVSVNSIYCSEYGKYLRQRQPGK